MRRAAAGSVALCGKVEDRCRTKRSGSASGLIVSVRVYSVGLFAKVLLGQIVFWFAEQPHLGIGGRITVH